MNTEERSRITVYGNALSHPIRIRILTLAATNGPMSPVNGSKVHKVGPLGIVSYHFTQLVRFECLKCTDSRPRNGGVEHFYGVTERGVNVLRIAEAIVKLPVEGQGDAGKGSELGGGPSI